MKILELDQWSSTATNLPSLNFKKFKYHKLKGGDVESARQIFGGHCSILEVTKYDVPSKGMVWFEEKDGKFVKYKAEYDTS